MRTIYTVIITVLMLTACGPTGTGEANKEPGKTDTAKSRSADSSSDSLVHRDTAAAKKQYSQ